MILKIKTQSSRQTKKIAKDLAQKILKIKPKREKALILAFSGDLGSGKTTFIQGFLKGLGINKRVTSPTFIIIKNYKIKDTNHQKKAYEKFRRAYHIDCYRITKPEEIINLGVKQLFQDRQAIILIEWAEKIKNILPKDTIWLKFEYGEKENERKIIVKSKFKRRKLKCKMKLF